MRSVPFLASLSLALLSLAAPAAAAPGDLDTSFGSSGVAYADFGGPAAGVFDRAANVDLARQADGKLVVVGGAAGGGFAAARFNPDGSPDGGFGAGGRTTIPIAGGAANSVVIQPDGKIVLAGSSGTSPNLRMTLARLNPDGSVDSSFGSGGTSVADPSRDTLAYDVALLPDGKFVVVGTVIQEGCGACWTHARFSANGQFEELRPNTQIVDSEAYAVAVQPDGRIASVGESSDAWTFARHTATFSPDPALSDGYVQDPIGTPRREFDSSAASLILHADNRLTAAGRAGLARSCSSCFAVARYTEAAALDRTFSRDGTSVVPFGPLGGAASAAAYDLAEEVDGKVVVVGTAESRSGGARQFALLRYDGAGVDETFGRSGAATAQIGEASEDADVGAHAVLVEPGGGIVTAGIAQQGGHEVLALARFQGGDGPPDTTRPSAKVRRPLGQRLRFDVARRGYLCEFAVSEAAGVVCDVFYGGKRIGGKGTRTEERADYAKVRVRLKSSARARLKRVRSARFTIRLTVADDAENVRIVKRRVRVRR